jgi:hypothetical protein
MHALAVQPDPGQAKRPPNPRGPHATRRPSISSPRAARQAKVPPAIGRPPHSAVIAHAAAQNRPLLGLRQAEHKLDPPLAGVDRDQALAVRQFRIIDRDQLRLAVIGRTPQSTRGFSSGSLAVAWNRPVTPSFTRLHAPCAQQQLPVPGGSPRRPGSSAVRAALGSRRRNTGRASRRCAPPAQQRT